MTLDLSNPAVSFLFFTGFGLWTIFVAWAHEMAVDKWPQKVTGLAVVVSFLIALFVVITNALITP